MKNRKTELDNINSVGRTKIRIRRRLMEEEHKVPAQTPRPPSTQVEVEMKKEEPQSAAPLPRKK